MARGTQSRADTGAGELISFMSMRGVSECFSGGSASNAVRAGATPAG